MRPFLLVSLLVFSLIRLAVWRAENDRARDICSELEAGKGRVRTFVGTLELGALGGPRLLDPRFERGRVRRPFSGEVRLGDRAVSERAKTGLGVSVTGRFECRWPARNPAALADGFFEFRRPRVILRSEPRVTLSRQFDSSYLRLREKILAFLLGPFTRSPSLLAFERAIWVGDASGFPEDVQAFFKDGGMLQILALSGQHVWSLVTMVTLLTMPFFRLGFLVRWETIRRVYPAFRMGLPLLCALLLCLTSAGAPSMIRTTTMAFAYFALRLRRLECAGLQVTASSVAILFLAEPSLITSTGFMLSAAATSLNLRAATGTGIRRKLAVYLYSSLVMPILMTPVSVFYFSRLAWKSPVCNLLVSWFWDLVLIPAGFLLPLGIRILPTSWRPDALAFLEMLWQPALAAHSQLALWIRPARSLFFRPSLFELFVLEFFLALLFVRVGEKLFQRDPHESTGKRLHFMRKGFPIKQ